MDLLSLVFAGFALVGGVVVVVVVVGGNVFDMIGVCLCRFCCLFVIVSFFCVYVVVSCALLLSVCVSGLLAAKLLIRFLHGQWNKRKQMNE